MRKTFVAAAMLAVTATAGATAFALTPASAFADTTTGQTQAAPAEAADGTPEGAVEWYQAHQGDASYQGLCEKAAENSYGTTGVWASALAHWQGALDNGKAHEGDKNPPAGAFVYWNISQYGHVGIADGNGGILASSIDGAIGSADSVDYFDNYLGWSEPGVPDGSTLAPGATQH